MTIHHEAKREQQCWFHSSCHCMLTLSHTVRPNFSLLAPILPFYCISSDVSHSWRMAFTDAASEIELNLLTHSRSFSLLHSSQVFTLPSSAFLQLRDLEMSHHYEDRSSESTFRDSRSHSQDTSEPPDLPMPTCFRSRSHSYLRAIQAGCSQDDDTASMDSCCSPPLTDPTVRTYSSSTGESAAQPTVKDTFMSPFPESGFDLYLL